MNYYTHHLGDYAAATGHLSWDEDAAYTRLIRAYYHQEKPIPLDLKDAYRLARAQSAAQRKAVETVLQEFFTRCDDGWHQKRCDEEIDRFKDKQSKAKRSADARWSTKPSDSEGNANALETHTERIADAVPPQSEGNAPNPNPNPNPKEQRAQRLAEARGVAGLDLETFDRWLSYRAERKPAIKPISLVAAAEELAKFGERQAEVVRHSMANGYQGLVPPKVNGAQPHGKDPYANSI